jgi:hypothetical protein
VEKARKRQRSTFNEEGDRGEKRLAKWEEIHRSKEKTFNAKLLTAQVVADQPSP